MRLVLIFITLAFFSLQAHAFFSTDVELIYKRKVEEGPILTQEYYKRLSIWPEQVASVKTRSGLQCDVMINFVKNGDSYGPEDQLSMNITIKNVKLHKELFSKKKIPLSLNTKKSFNFTSKTGDELLLSITPRIQRPL